MLSVINSYKISCLKQDWKLLESVCVQLRVVELSGHGQQVIETCPNDVSILRKFAALFQSPIFKANLCHPCLKTTMILV